MSQPQKISSVSVSKTLKTALPQLEVESRERNAYTSIFQLAEKFLNTNGSDKEGDIKSLNKSITTPKKGQRKVINVEPIVQYLTQFNRKFCEIAKSIAKGMIQQNKSVEEDLYNLSNLLSEISTTFMTAKIVICKNLKNSSLSLEELLQIIECQQIFKSQFQKLIGETNDFKFQGFVEQYFDICFNFLNKIKVFIIDNKDRHSSNTSTSTTILSVEKTEQKNLEKVSTNKEEKSKETKDQQVIANGVSIEAEEVKKINKGRAKKKKKRNKKIWDIGEEEEENAEESQLKKTQKNFMKNDTQNLFSETYQQTKRNTLRQTVKLSTDDSEIEFYKESRIIFKRIYEYFQLQYNNNKDLFIAKLTKNQVVRKAEGSHVINLDDIESISNYIVENSFNFNIIEKITPLNFGGEAQILLLKVIQPFELVIKIPRPQEGEYQTLLALNELLLESHLLKLLSHKEYIAEIMEEIIEYDVDKKKIQNYVVIVEKAVFDLKQIKEIWKDKEKAQKHQEWFSEEKLAYFCLKAMEAMDYVHSKRVYYGDMKPENLLVFRDMSVKLGDFGISIKIPDELSEEKVMEYETQIKGLTHYYTKPQFYQRFNEEMGYAMFSYFELLENDYFTLAKTFDTILEEFQDKISTNSLFYWMVYDLSQLKVKEMQLSTVLFKWRTILANDKVFITKLCNQIINEEKLSAIPNILKLSRYKVVFSQIQNHFKRKEQKHLKYLDESQFQPISEDSLIQQQEEEEIHKNYHHIYFPKGLEDEEFMDFIYEDIEPYISKLLYYKGGLEEQIYQKYFYKTFQKQYKINNNQGELLWLNLVESKNQIADIFNGNKDKFQRFAQFHSFTVSHQSPNFAQNLKILIQVAEKFKFIHLELELLFILNEVLLKQKGEIKTLSVIESNAMKALKLYDQKFQLQQDDYMINVMVFKIQLQLVLSKYQQKQINNLQELEDVMMRVDHLKEVQQYFAESYFSRIYAIKAFLPEVKLRESGKNSIYYLKKEREQYSKYFGEFGDQMTLNAFNLHKAYKEIQNDEQSIYYLKKVANYSTPNKRIRYLAQLAKYYEQSLQEGLILEVLNQCKKLNFVMAFILAKSLEVQITKFKVEKFQQRALNELRDYMKFQHLKTHFFDKQSIFLIGLAKIFKLSQVTEQNILYCYNEWIDNQELQEFNQFDIKAYITKNQSLNQLDVKQIQSFIKTEIIFPNNTNYKGNIYNYEFNGEGVLTYFDGRKYEGQFKNNKKSELGKLEYPDGIVYEGSFKENKRCGIGKQVYQNNEVYEGMWLNNQRSGKGSYSTIGYRYKGDWLLDLEHGQGKADYKQTFGKGPQKEKKDFNYEQVQPLLYRGEFANGMKNGNGTMEYTDGSTYSGNWTNNQKNGLGKLVYSLDQVDLEWYKGYFLNDKRHGKGILKYTNGNVYEGEFNEDQIEGIGKLKQQDGVVYVGGWKNGLKQGKGELINEKGEIYQCTWENDFMKGMGKVISIDGIEAEFEFYKNKEVVLKKIRRKDGYLFEGLVQLGTEIKHGYGKFQSSKKSELYEGEFVNDLYEGNGKLVYPEGQQNNEQEYSGNFFNGLRHGKGKIIFRNGDQFIGMFLNGLRNGEGIYVKIDGTKTKLMFLNDQVIEYKICVFPNGDKYEGYTLLGKKHGKGTLEHANGDIYEGHFENNKKQGKGRLNLAQGGYLEGMFKNDNIVKFGKQVLPNGDIYKGKFKQGIKNGKGRLNFSAGGSYQGWFRNDQMDGQGVLINENGDKYEGSFEFNQKHGFGKEQYANGDSYQGEYKNNKKHGRGFYQFADGHTYEGEFFYDFMKETKTIAFENGDVYEGDAYGNMKHGQGKVLQKSGLSIEGFWDEDMMHGECLLKLPNNSVFNGQFEKGVLQGEGTIQMPNGDKKQITIQELLQHCAGVQDFIQNNIEIDDIEYGEEEENDDIQGVAAQSQQQNRDEKDGYDVQKQISSQLFQQLYFRLKPNSQFHELKGKKDQQETQLMDEDQKKTNQPKVMPNGATYSGQWLGELRHGFGIQVWPDNSKYEGYWENDKANGTGKFYSADGNIYEGEWLNDLKHGKGCYTKADGSAYKGDWHQDEKYGYGEENWVDGSSYKGDYIDGKMHGTGCFTWADGSTYTGSFYEGNIEGAGVLNKINGHKYVGEWKNNNMHGKGEFIYPDGSIYIGEFQNDKKEGYGCYKWPDSREYRGQWKGGKQHGEGLQIYQNGQQKKGIWSNGKRINWI